MHVIHNDAEWLWHSLHEARRASPHLVTRGLERVDEAFRTTTPEYLDRSDINPRRREAIIDALDRTHLILGTYHRVCRHLIPIAMEASAPRILETSAGHGKLSIVLERSLTSLGVEATVTGSDVAPNLVALATRNAEAARSAARFTLMNATRLEAADNAYDLVVNAMAMHHLRFDQLVQALREMRRVSPRAVIVDLVRSPLLFIPAGTVMFALSFSVDCTHDGLISLRKAWSRRDWSLAIALAGWPPAAFSFIFPGYLMINLRREP